MKKLLIALLPVVFVACNTARTIDQSIPISFDSTLSEIETDHLPAAVEVLARQCGFSEQWRPSIDSIRIERENCLWCEDHPLTDTWTKTYQVVVFVNGNAPEKFRHHRMYYGLGLDGKPGVIGHKSVAQEICGFRERIVHLPDLQVVGASIQIRSRRDF